MAARVHETRNVAGAASGSHIKLIHDEIIASRGRSIAVGVLLGASAAIVGVVPLVGSAGVRPWHLLVIVAFVVALPPVRLWGRYRPTVFDALLFAMVVTAVCAEAYNSRDLSLTPDVVSVVTPIFYLLAYIAARLVSGNLESLGGFLRGFVIPVAPTVLLAACQAFHIEPIAQLVLQVAPSSGAEARIDAGSLIRATALIGHWTGYGAYLTVSACAALTLLILIKEGRISAGRGQTQFIVLAAVAIGVLSTATISVISTVLLMFVVSLRALRVRVGMTAAIATAGAALWIAFAPILLSRFEQQTNAQRSAGTTGLPEWLPDTILYRARVWLEQTIPMIVDRPLSGWGSGVYELSDPHRLYPNRLVWHSSESQWLGQAMSFGLIGLVPLALIAVSLILVVLRARAKAKGVSRALNPLTVLVIMTFLTAFTVSIYTNRGFPAAFWPLFGAIIQASPLLTGGSGTSAVVVQEESERSER